MKSYYRVMLGKKSAHPPECFAGGFIGTNFCIPVADESRGVAEGWQLMALLDALELQLATSRSSVEKLLTTLVAELTGTKSNGKASTPSASGPARRGRTRKAT